MDPPNGVGLPLGFPPKPNRKGIQLLKKTHPPTVEKQMGVTIHEDPWIQNKRVTINGGSWRPVFQVVGADHPPQSHPIPFRVEFPGSQSFTGGFMAGFSGSGCQDLASAFAVNSVATSGGCGGVSLRAEGGGGLRPPAWDFVC